MQGHQALSPSLEKDVMGSRCVIVGTNRYIAFIHGTRLATISFISAFMKHWFKLGPVLWSECNGSVSVLLSLFVRVTENCTGLSPSPSV